MSSLPVPGHAVVYSALYSAQRCSVI